MEPAGADAHKVKSALNHMYLALASPSTATDILSESII